ncbi:MAG: hypothetical protein EZS28_003646 [Streblomastix strix]|uniref:Uncharacterized protein n=1 Tax=Streblomastix strix TaxID=222440 RepID=A0A5J4X0E0_9EUKA|nr:MAG: hypothetical protein EZS28_003646 [Streblomastix strix]
MANASTDEAIILQRSGNLTVESIRFYYTTYLVPSETIAPYSALIKLVDNQQFGSLTVKDCLFYGLGTALASLSSSRFIEGNSLYLMNFANVIFSTALIKNNTAAVFATTQSLTELAISDSAFYFIQLIHTDIDGYGALCVYLDGMDQILTITKTIFQGCYSDQSTKGYAGALFIRGAATDMSLKFNHTISLTQNTFNLCRGIYTGGIYMQVHDTNILDFSDNTFTNNIRSGQTQPATDAYIKWFNPVPSKWEGNNNETIKALFVNSTSNREISVQYVLPGITTGDNYIDLEYANINFYADQASGDDINYDGLSTSQPKKTISACLPVAGYQYVWNDNRTRIFVSVESSSQTGSVTLPAGMQYRSFEITGHGSAQTSWTGENTNDYMYTLNIQTTKALNVTVKELTMKVGSAGRAFVINSAVSENTILLLQNIVFGGSSYGYVSILNPSMNIIDHCDFTGISQSNSYFDVVNNQGTGPMVIRSCTFGQTGSQTNLNNPAINVIQSSNNVTITDTQFTNLNSVYSTSIYGPFNYRTRSAAILLQMKTYKIISIVGCTFTDCYDIDNEYATWDNYLSAGAICIVPSSGGVTDVAVGQDVSILGGVQIDSCRFERCKGWSSGAILIDRTRFHSSLNITNCEFIDNEFYGIFNFNSSWASGYASDIATVDKNAQFENDGSYKKKINLQIPDINYSTQLPQVCYGQIGTTIQPVNQVRKEIHRVTSNISFIFNEVFVGDGGIHLPDETISWTPQMKSSNYDPFGRYRVTPFANIETALLRAPTDPLNTVNVIIVTALANVAVTIETGLIPDKCDTVYIKRETFGSIPGQQTFATCGRLFSHPGVVDAMFTVRDQKTLKLQFLNLIGLSHDNDSPYFGQTLIVALNKSVLVLSDIYLQMQDDISGVYNQMASQYPSRKIALKSFIEVNSSSLTLSQFVLAFGRFYEKGAIAVEIKENLPVTIQNGQFWNLNQAGVKFASSQANANNPTSGAIFAVLKQNVKNSIPQITVDNCLFYKCGGLTSTAGACYFEGINFQDQLGNISITRSNFTECSGIQAGGIMFGPNIYPLAVTRSTFTDNFLTSTYQSTQSAKDVFFSDRQILNEAGNVDAVLSGYICPVVSDIPTGEVKVTRFDTNFAPYLLCLTANPVSADLCKQPCGYEFETQPVQCEYIPPEEDPSPDDPDEQVDPGQKWPDPVDLEGSGSSNSTIIDKDDTPKEPIPKDTSIKVWMYVLIGLAAALIIVVMIVAIICLYYARRNYLQRMRYKTQPAKRPKQVQKKRENKKTVEMQEQQQQQQQVFSPQPQQYSENAGLVDNAYV